MRLYLPLLLARETRGGPGRPLHPRQSTAVWEPLQALPAGTGRYLHCGGPEQSMYRIRKVRRAVMERTQPL